MRASYGDVNTRFYARRDLVDHDAYTSRDLRPPEVGVLLRHREALSGRVLDVGCGTGRLTGYLTLMAASVHGVDVSEAMLDHCRRTYPDATYSQADMRDLSGFDDQAFNAIIASYSVLDVLDQSERLRTLGGFHRVLSVGGLLVISTHNLAHAPQVRSPGGDVLAHLRAGAPRRALSSVTRLARRSRNHHRMRGHEAAGEGYRIINDPAHDYSLLHYYIGRQDQYRQLGDLGFEVLECRDLEDKLLEPEDPAGYCHELHYVARRA
jgi:SAM-dependent methyltransferase